MGYKETNHQTGPSLDISVTTIRSNTLYAPPGYVLSYREDQIGPTGSSFKIWTGDGYNGLGHLTGFTEEGTGPQGPTYHRLDNIGYDDQERQESNHELTGRSDSIISLDHTVTCLLYTSRCV